MTMRVPARRITRRDGHKKWYPKRRPSDMLPGRKAWKNCFGGTKQSAPTGRSASPAWASRVATALHANKATRSTCRRPRSSASSSSCRSSWARLVPRLGVSGAEMAWTNDDGGRRTPTSKSSLHASCCCPCSADIHAHPPNCSRMARGTSSNGASWRRK